MKKSETELEKIKGRVKALLDKTTANGATEAEMSSAFALASQLMEKYFLSDSDLVNADRITHRRVDVFKSTFETRGFLNSISRLFDCQVFLQGNSSIIFYGYTEDLDMCEYFYVQVCKALRSNIISLSRGRNTSNFMRGFVDGFTRTISTRLGDLYAERQAARCGERGLVLASKKPRVDEALKMSGFRKGRETKLKDNNGSLEGYDEGVARGKEHRFSQGLGGGEYEKLT